MRERLTYKVLIQLFGAIVLFFVAYIKATETPITLGSTILKPDGVEALIAGASGILAIIVPLFITDERASKPIFPKQDSALSEATRKDNRQRMLDKVETIWITGYLDHVLNEMAALRLDMTFVEPEKVLQRAGMTDQDLPDSGAILSAFNELNRRLVILGEPGAGKTVTLLQLCRELLAEARKDERKPIPIVLALSSWAAFEGQFSEKNEKPTIIRRLFTVFPALDKQSSEKNEKPSLETWLRREIREKYGLSRKVADDFVQGEQLIYLLDGLDELTVRQRDSCVRAIKQFMEDERPIHYAICCRTIEFQKIRSRLNLSSDITLEPLTDEQIRGYLSGAEFMGLLPLWSDSKPLRAFRRIPFMLNTIAVVARDKSEHQLRQELGKGNNEADLRNRLLEAYIDQRLKEQSNARYPNLRQSRLRLRWLAQEFIRHSQTDFYIENLQPDWLDSEAHLRRYRRIALGAAGITLGFGLTFELLPIFLPEILSIPNAQLPLWIGVALLIITCMITGAICSFLWLGRFFDVRRIKISDQLVWSLNPSGLLGGIVLGLLLGISISPLGGLIVGAAFPLLTGFQSSEQIKVRVRANAGIRRSLINFLAICLASAAAFGIGGSLINAAPIGLSMGLGLGIQGGIAIGAGWTLIQHCTLRFLLAREGHIPYWRYDQFLDYCADLVILRKVGGGYRFVHDYMRQYLASAAFVPDAPPTPPEN